LPIKLDLILKSGIIYFKKANGVAQTTWWLRYMQPAFTKPFRLHMLASFASFFKTSFKSFEAWDGSSNIFTTMPSLTITEVGNVTVLPGNYQIIINSSSSGF
jgi:hypothetical protein